jgi:uncharacterized protein (TIGR02284 family)
MNGRDEQSARATRAQHEERVRYTERRGAGNGERPEAQDPRALEHTIERHRENIDQTLSALESKLSPNELIEKGLQHVVGGGGSLLESLKHTAREQPVPMALIGAGLAWLLFGPAKSGDAPASAQQAPAPRRDPDIPASEDFRDVYLYCLQQEYPFDPDQLECILYEDLGAEALQDYDLRGAGARTRRAGAGRRGGAGRHEEEAGVIEQAKARARESRDEVLSRIYKTRSRMAEGGGEAKERLERARAEAWRRAKRAQAAFEHGARDVAHRAEEAIERYPLVLVGLGLAAGAALGGAIPETRAEDRLMGEASDALKARGTTLAREQGARAKEAVAAAGEAVREAAHEAGEAAREAVHARGREGPRERARGGREGPRERRRDGPAEHRAPERQVRRRGGGRLGGARRAGTPRRRPVRAAGARDARARRAHRPRGRREGPARLVALSGGGARAPSGHFDARAGRACACVAPSSTGTTASASSPVPESASTPSTTRNATRSAPAAWWWSRAGAPPSSPATSTARSSAIRNDGPRRLYRGGTTRGVGAYPRRQCVRDASSAPPRHFVPPHGSCIATTATDGGAPSRAAPHFNTQANNRGNPTMATTVGNESNLNERLANLVRLDHDAIAAYESAIERLDDASSKEKLAELMADHQEHTGNLGAHLQAMGHEVPAAGSMKSMLTQGKVLIAGLMGDKTILQAMKSNEEDTNTAYGRAVEHEDTPAQVKATLEQNLADERRHHAWIEERIGQL